MVDERARGLIGVPFRLHGRDPATGLDCVGVVALAVGGAVVPTGYRMRQGSADAIVAGLDGALVRVDVARAGDVLLFEAGAAQFHLGVMTEGALCTRVRCCGGWWRRRGCRCGR
jgi:lipoprotein Spr